MQTIAGLLALPILASMVWLGYNDKPWWWILIGGAIGTILYLMVRPDILLGDLQERRLSAPLYYFGAQCLTFGIPFGIGRLAVAIF